MLCRYVNGGKRCHDDDVKGRNHEVGDKMVMKKRGIWRLIYC